MVSGNSYPGNTQPQTQFDLVAEPLTAVSDDACCIWKLDDASVGDKPSSVDG